MIDKRKARADRYVRRNMRREARLLQRIRHNHIVQLLDVMETNNGFYLVMEYCGGGDLMTRICDSRTIDENDARHYVRQIVSAVDYLHRGGILHRYSEAYVRDWTYFMPKRNFPMKTNLLCFSFHGVRVMRHRQF